MTCSICGKILLNEDERVEGCCLACLRDIRESLRDDSRRYDGFENDKESLLEELIGKKKKRK